MIQTKLTGQCITATPFILEVEIDGIIAIQNSQLVMVPRVYLKDKVEPFGVPITCKFVT